MVLAGSVFFGLVPSARPAAKEAEVGPFFAKPEYRAPAIAPDGKHIISLVQIAQRSRLFSLQLDPRQIQELSTTEQGDVGRAWWLGSNRVLFWAHNEAGWSFYVRDLNETKARHLKSLDGWPTDWITTLANDPVHVMAFKEGVISRFDVERDSAKVLGRVDYGWPVLSLNGELRAMVDFDWLNKEWKIKWRADASGKWTELRDDITKPGFKPFGIARDDRHIIGIAYDQGDTSALMSLDPATGQRTLIAQRPDCDVSKVIWDSAERCVIGGEFYNYERHDRVFIDPADAKLQAAIDQAIPGVTNELMSASSDGLLQIFASYGPSCPPVYCLLDRKQGRISQLGSSYPSLLPKQLGRTEHFQFKCDDGLPGYGYVVLPPAGVGRKPAPLLVRTPDSADADAEPPVLFYPEDQYLASRGYAVVHFTVRGNYGFGRRFRHAGNFQFADQVPKDFEAGLRHLSGTGWIDPKRIAVLGVQRSGLLALRLAAGSESYRSVIAVNSPGSLPSENLRWMYAEPIDLSRLIDQVGGSQKAEQLLRPLWPESTVPKISVPVLLIHSPMDDLHYYMWQTRGLLYVLQDNHKDVEWYQIDVNRDVVKNTYAQQLWTKVADFLDKTLK